MLDNSRPLLHMAMRHATPYASHSFITHGLLHAIIVSALHTLRYADMLAMRDIDIDEPLPRYIGHCHFHITIDAGFAYMIFSPLLCYAFSLLLLFLRL